MVVIVIETMVMIAITIVMLVIRRMVMIVIRMVVIVIRMVMIVIRMVVMTGKRPNAVGSGARKGGFGRMGKRKVMAEMPSFAN